VKKKLGGQITKKKKKNLWVINRWINYREKEDYSSFSSPYTFLKNPNKKT
jgi:hypothetical protein